MSSYLAVAATILAAMIASWTALRIRRPRPAELHLVGTAYYVSVGPVDRMHGIPSAVTEPRPLDPAEKINIYHLDRQYLYTADLRTPAGTTRCSRACTSGEPPARCRHRASTG